MSEIIEIISQEISSMTLSIVFNMLIYIAFAWFISKFAKNTIPRLLWIILGAYLIFTPKASDTILFNIDTLFGIGFILPHIRFFLEWLNEIFEELKRATIDTYVFALTIYYKIRNFFLWFYDIYKKIHNFFTKEKSSKQEQNDYYQEQQKQEYKNYKQSSNYDRAKQRKDQREQEESHSYEYEKASAEQESDYAEEKTYQEQQYQESSSYTHETTSSEHKLKQELSLEEQLMLDERYKHLFSQSAYTVIGVSVNDDFKTMKNRYRALAKEYHPDKNRGESDKYNILLQRINGAYETLQKFHKK